MLKCAKLHSSKKVNIFLELECPPPLYMGLSWWLRQQRICLQYRRHRFDPWVRKIPWRMEWQPTSLFLPGEFHGQRNLAGYSPWVAKSWTQLSDWHFHFLSFIHTHTHTHTYICNSYLHWLPGKPMFVPSTVKWPQYSFKFFLQVPKQSFLNA